MKRNRLTTAVLLLLACTLMLSSCGVFTDEEGRFTGIGPAFEKIGTFFRNLPEKFQKTELVYESMGDGTCRVLLDQACRGETVVIPETSPEGDVVVRVGDFRCRSLTGVQIPDTVTEIESMAFADCSDLVEVVLSENLQFIGLAAFSGCGIRELVIPASVQSIGMAAFAFCKELERIDVMDDNEFYHDSENTCLIETESKTLVFGCSNAVIPSDGSVTKIATAAFAGSVIQELFVPAAITEIENDDRMADFGLNPGAFADCESLYSIVVEEGNPVYHSAGNCIIETASKTLVLGCFLSDIPTDGSVTGIANGAFSGCSSLQELKIPGGVTDIEPYAIFSCENLKTVTFGGTVEEWKVATESFFKFNSFGTEMSVTVTCTDGETDFN